MMGETALAGTFPSATNVQQRPNEIKGKVVDNKGEAVIGANVMIKGTTIGTLTDANGNYVLSIPDRKGTLSISYLGYNTFETPIGTKLVINVSLTENAEQLQEVVVTALGIKREEKALGYSVAQLDDKAVTTAKSANMINSLSGKISGVNVRSSASDPGSTVFINIRGQRSLSGDNQPLIVLDGIPVNNSVSNSTNIMGGSSNKIVDYGNPISDINPDDVASISVLKGAAAAALYGSRAANGVILITTKTGSKQKKGIGISFNESASYDKAYLFPKFQNKFGSGDWSGTSRVIIDSTWGPRLDVGTKYVQWDSPKDSSGNPIATDWVSYPNRIKDFFETGYTYITNVAANGANDKGNFRLSYTNLSNNGIMPNTDLKRNNVNLSASYQLHPKFKVNTNIAYTYSKSNNRPAVNRGSAIYVVYRQPANINVQKLRNYWKEGYEGLQQWSPVPGGNDNPYFVAYENINAYNRDRITGNIQFNWDISPYFSIMGRTGLDFYNETRESHSAFSSSSYPTGAYSLANSYFRERNTDFLATFKKNLTDNWFFSVSVGANRMNQSGNNDQIGTTKLVMPGVYNISNAAAGYVQNNTSTYKYKKRINSIYGMSQVGFKNMIFLDLTARNDWSSTLPSDNNSYFYPSASLSVLLSDMLGLSAKNKISYIKLRGNISQVGSDVSPYTLNNTVTVSSWGNTSQANQETNLKNSSLKPEISTSSEIGAEMRFFGNRLGLDFTYYITKIKNQVMNISTTMASGYSAKVINAGKIQNKGIEFTLKGTPIDNEFKWEIAANFSRNRNKILKLAEGITEINIGGGEGVNYYAREGKELGDIYARTWETVPSGPYKGEPILTMNGFKVKNEWEKIGNYNPDFMVGFTNTFSFKGFTLNALIDWRQGGDFYSYVAKNLISDGRTTNTLFGRNAEYGGLPWKSGGIQRDDGMLLHGFFNTGGDNYVQNTSLYVSPPTYYGALYWSFNKLTTFSATYVKLREVSLDYTFSKNTIRNFPITNLTIGIWGHNIFTWTEANQGYDPETAMTFTSGSITPGVCGWTLPGTRTFGFKLGVNF